MLITTRLLSIAFHWRQILLQTLVVVDSESCRHSFFCTQPSEVRFKSEQTSFLRTGCQLRSAALHRIQFETFVPMSYFYSETDRWLKNWECQWALLWSATTSFQYQRIFQVLFQMEKKMDWTRSKISNSSCDSTWFWKLKWSILQCFITVHGAPAMFWMHMRSLPLQSYLSLTVRT